MIGMYEVQRKLGMVQWFAINQCLTVDDAREEIATWKRMEPDCHATYRIVQIVDQTA